MKKPLVPLFALLCLFPLAVFAARAQPPVAPKQSVQNPLAPRFKQVRERIDTLFEHRNETPPPLNPAYNPFLRPSSVVSVPVAVAAPRSGLPGRPESGTSPTTSTNLMVLQQGAASLKVSGVFEIGGKSHLVINARPYKEGDVVQTQVQGETIYLRVREISKRSVTLALNDAEITLKF